MKELDIELNDTQVQQFLTYYELLIEWNSNMNLTTITIYEDVVIKHFIDSISLVKVINLNNDLNIIDIGTGAGFPGIPISIVFPHLNITLLDSLMKRINFLDFVIDNIKLKNINTIHGRAEDYAKDNKHREKYDLAISRAVANLSVLSEYCLPFVKIDGLFISYKSEKIQVEAEEAKKSFDILGGKFFRQANYTLPNSDVFRCLYSIKKISITDKKYPRKAGIPLKNPI
ncbi:MAG: 16S rRNA (guanine(527)-N(7))-methyltransferase RsmG [Eubacteriales bacterium]